MPGIVGVREVTCRHLLTTNAFMPHLHDLIVARCTTAPPRTVTLWVILSGQCWAVSVYDNVLFAGFVLERRGTQSTHHRTVPYEAIMDAIQIHRKKNLHYTIPDVFVSSFH